MSSELELTPVVFPRREKRGLILGLEFFPLLAVLLLGVFVVIFAVVLPFPWGWIIDLFVMFPLIFVVGWGRFNGLHLFDWISLGFTHYLRQVMGQNTFIRASKDADALAEAKVDRVTAKKDAKARAEAEALDEPVPARTPKPVRLKLPGAAHELSLYESPMGYCVVHNPIKKRMTITAVMNAKSYMLQDDIDQADVLDGWSEVISSIGSHAEVQSMFASDVTSVVTGDQMREYYEQAAIRNHAGAELNPIAHQGYMDLLVKNVMKHHPQYFTVNLSLASLATEIKEHGGGINGMLSVADVKMTAFEEDLSSSDFKVDHWISVEERKNITFDAYCPSPNGPEFAVPVQGAQRYWSEMHINDMWHRSFIVEEWPLKPTKPGFMSKIILDLDFHHAVTQVIKRGDDEAALRKINTEIKNYETAQDISERAGRRISRESMRELADLEKREEEMVEGASDVSFNCYVSITAASKEELDSYQRQLMAAASRARLKLAVCYGAQYEGFLAASAQLGYGADRY